MKPCAHCGVPLRPEDVTIAWCVECHVEHVVCYPCSKNLATLEKRAKRRRSSRKV